MNTNFAKTITLIVSLIFCSFNYIHSQGLIITYEETNTFELPSPQIDDPRIRDNPQILAAIENNRRNMNSSTSKTSQLMIDNGVSIYKIQDSKQSDNRTIRSEDGNATITSGFQSVNVAPHIIYKNLHDKLMLSQISFDKNEYLIEEPINELKWKIGRKKEMISGYQCIEATAKTSNGTKITAWYTPDIPVNDGPYTYCGLPGLILYLDVTTGNSTRVFSCTSIEQTNDSLAIDAPDKGEKISRERYNEMVAEKVEILKKNSINNRPDEHRNNSTRRSGIITL